MTDVVLAGNEMVEAPTPIEDTPPQETGDVASEDAQPQAPTELQGEQGETKKPTRAERRVEQLLHKLKDRPQPPTYQAKDQPLITQEEYETGIDPQALEQRLNQRLEATSAKTREAIRTELAYENEARSHMADLESASKDLDPKLEKLAVRQYEALNYTYDPFSGQRVFVPTVKFSEIVNQVKADLEDITTTRVAESTQRIARAAQEAAIQPGVGGKDKVALTDLQKNIWRNPEAVARELEGRLGYSE